MTNGYNTPIGVPIGLPSILSLGLPPLVNPYPTLNLDFINNPQFDSRITFSRGSQATLFDSTGTLIFAPSNTIRNSAATGAVAGTPGTMPTNWATFTTRTGLTREIVGTGTENGINYIDIRISGTPNTSGNYSVLFETNTGVSAANAQNWAQSVYLKLQSGSFSGISSVVQNQDERSTTTYIRTNSSAPITITSQALSTQRFVFSSTLSGGATVAHLVPYLTLTLDGAAIDITLRIGLPQLQRGSVATAAVATTGTAYFAPRFDYNPSTLQPLGLLIEEQRTNGIRNNTMQGAVVGTPGTVPTNWASAATVALTQQIVGVGTENGITYLDFRVSGTPSGDGVLDLSFEASNQVAASNGQTWTNSSYVRLVGGSVTNVDCKMLLRGRGSGGAAIAGQAVETSFVPTSAALSTQRAFATFTMSSASVLFALPSIRFSYTNGNSFDITLRIGLPQLEQGAFATSVIPTTTTALTRNADVASMTGTNFSSWYNATNGSLFVTCVNTGNLGIAAPRPASMSNGTNNNLIEFFGSTASAMGFQVNNGGVTQANIAQTANSSTANKLAGAYAANDFALSINGAAVGTDTSGTVPTVDRLQIGNRQDLARPWNGYIQLLSFYPTRLPNATLQALTA